MVNKYCEGKTCEECWLKFTSQPKEFNPLETDQPILFIRPPKIVLPLLTSERCFKTDLCVLHGIEGDEDVR